MDVQILKWVRDVAEYHRPLKRVLELGSLDVNGSIRPAFDQCGVLDYVGIDQRPGTGVDVVLNTADLYEAHHLGQFDCVVATSFFEHDRQFWQTLDGVYRRLNHGGVFIVTVPHQDWGYHGEPKDYYRYTADALKDVFFDRYGLVTIMDALWPTPEHMPHLKCQHMGGWGVK